MRERDYNGEALTKACGEGGIFQERVFEDSDSCFLLREEFVNVTKGPIWEVLDGRSKFRRIKKRKLVGFMKHCVSNTTTDTQMCAECSTACVYHNFHVRMYVNNSLWEGLQMVKLGRRPPEGNRRCWEAGEWTRSYRVRRAWDREEG